MHVYDFDGTIYDGDSSKDFYKFCIKKNKRCLRILPKFFITSLLYILKMKEKEELKSVYFSFVKYFDNIDAVIEEFWKSHKIKIRSWYLNIKKNDDYIISASPEFLLKYITDELQVNLIASKFNSKTGIIEGKNCYGEEKVRRIEKVTNKKIMKFYSDSLSDSPLKKIAKEAFIVKKDNIIKWDEYKESSLKKLIKLFLSRDFILFVFIGIINVFNGVWIAYVYSLFMNNPIIAYIFGFLTSLSIAYVLNSKLNFKSKLSVNKFIKFAISNIPNFVIQIFSVVVLLNILELPKIVSYFVSAVVAVPITFVLVKINVFKK